MIYQALTALVTIYKALHTYNRRIRADYCLLARCQQTKDQMQFDRWLAEVKAQAVAEWLAERMAAFEKADLEAYEQGETE